jgi:nitronate monooxygenase
MSPHAALPGASAPTDATAASRLGAAAAAAAETRAAPNPGDVVHPALQRATAFSWRFGLRMPLLLAPMAGVPSVALSAAVAQAGGMAAMGALLLSPAAITDWVAQFRSIAGADAPVQLNLWIPDPPPRRDTAHEARLRDFLAGFGPPVPAEAADAPLPDFAAQCEALLAARPRVVSSIMGVYDAAFVTRLHAAGIAWFATVTTLAEARTALAAGADALVAQGAEAGGHRGAFDATRARDEAVGLMALLPAVADLADAARPGGVPVIATGGIADGRGVAAALLLGASAVQIGSAYLATPEAGIAPSWAAALPGMAPEATALTRAFSGRWGRALASDYVHAAAAATAPEPAPYPVQRALTAAMRQQAQHTDDLQRLQAWAGQGAGLSRAEPAAALTQGVWRDALALLGAA